MGLGEPCCWERTVYFINEIEIDHQFKPIELNKFVYGNDNIKSTVGSYIHFLSEAKYIERVSQGLYQKKKEIPLNLNSTKLYNYLYNNPLKDRINKLNKIRNKLNNNI